MKKFIVFAVVLALLLPAAAFAAAEFSLGGYVKLDACWDTNSAVGRLFTFPPARKNDGNLNHGRLRFTAQSSRFNFTIKGPDLWGAQTSGFMEMDFDSNTERELLNLGFTASKSYTPRLRHAMFRFNWPTSELMLGQYWSMFSEYYAETTEDGPFQMTGTPTARLAQIRFTQKFLGDWTVAGLIGDTNQAILPSATTGPYNPSINNGQSAESPQVQAKVHYAHNFWGKAALNGKPTPFTAQITGGWQRNVMRGANGLAGIGTLGNAIPSAVPAVNVANDLGLQTAPINVKNQYVNPWLAMGSLFIPVIPTATDNLAGTASILTQWWIGQGVETFGFTGVAQNLYKFNSLFWDGNTLRYDYRAQLLKKFGGFIQGQYYINNQWYFNAAYAVSKAFGVSRARYYAVNGITALNGMEWATGDNAQTIQQAAVTLWYRPIQAIKFGIQYEYAAAHYFAYQNATPGFNGVANNINRSHFGDDHRVGFAGFFYF